MAFGFSPVLAGLGAAGNVAGGAINTYDALQRQRQQRLMQMQQMQAEQFKFQQAQQQQLATQRQGDAFRRLALGGLPQDQGPVALGGTPQPPMPPGAGMPPQGAMPPAGAPPMGQAPMGGGMQPPPQMGAGGPPQAVDWMGVLKRVAADPANAGLSGMDLVAVTDKLVAAQAPGQKQAWEQWKFQNGISAEKRYGEEEAGKRAAATQAGELEREKMRESAEMERTKLIQGGFGSRLQQNLTAKAQQAAQAGQPLDENMTTMIAESIHAGDWRPAQSILGFGGKNRPALMAQVFKTYHELYPDDTGASLASFEQQFAGGKAGATMLGRVGAGAALGGAEIAQSLPLAVQASKALGTTDYPTVNAVRNAYIRQAGTPEQQASLAQLNQFIAAMDSAYRLVIQRGGANAVHYQEQAEKLINGNMPIGALIADGEAIAKEAGIVRGAAGQAMGEVTRQPGAAAAPAAGGMPRIGSDAEYDALPSGAQFVAPDGTTRRKP